MTSQEHEETEEGCEIRRYVKDTPETMTMDDYFKLPDLDKKAYDVINLIGNIRETMCRENSYGRRAMNKAPWKLDDEVKITIFGWKKIKQLLTQAEERGYQRGLNEKNL